MNCKRWRRQRKSITPTFHFSILHTYIRSFYEEAKLLSEKISLEAKDGQYGDIDVTSKAQGEVELDMKLKLAGFDMIVRNVLGVQVNAQKNPQHPFLLSIIEILQVSTYSYKVAD